MLGVQFTLHACCNESCAPRFPPGDSTGVSFKDTNIAGHACLVSPPCADDTAAWLEHYAYHRQYAPINTSACFVVPEDQGPALQQAGFQLVHTYPAHAALFAAQDSHGSELPQSAPCVMHVYYDAPQKKVALRCLGHARDTREMHIMTLQSRYGAAAAACMLDSGADCADSAHGFVTHEFVKKHALTISRSSVPWVSLASGASSPIMGTVTATLRIGAFKQRAVKLLVLQAGVAGVDIILATDWLKANRATMCWENSTVTVRSGSHEYVLNPSHTRKGELAQDALFYATTVLLAIHNPQTLSAKQAANLLKKGARSFLLIVQEDGSIAAAGEPLLASLQADPPDQPDLCPEQAVTSLIEEYSSVFEPVGHFDTLQMKVQGAGGEHLIRIDPSVPYAPPRKAYRLSPKETEELKKQVTQLLALGMIEPANSPYGSPVLFVEKADGSLRMCVDYRALNKITVKDRYPMPNIQELFDQLKGAKVFSTLDLQQGYNQIKISEQDRPYTAFLAPGMGQYQYKVLAFGLTGAPSSFFRIVTNMLSNSGTDGVIKHDRLGKYVLAYMDDLIVFSRSPEEHLTHLRDVLQVLKDNNLKAKLSKCQFNKPELKFLGHIIGREGLKVDPEKIKVVEQWPQPQNVQKLRQFLGLANYFRRFIKDYSRIATPLTRLTGSKVQWDWTLGCQEAFEKIKFALTNAPVLQLPDPSLPYTVWSDASIVGSGAVLIQDGKPIAYTSRKFIPAEVNYTTTEQECLGIVNALKEWRCYLEGAVAIDVYTDHHPLTYLQNQQRDNVLNRRQARWMQELSRFHFNVIYKQGKTNIADPLSRIYEAPVLLATIRAGLVETLRGKFLRAYLLDENFSRVKHRHKLEERQGIWFNKEDQIIVPEEPSLRQHILAHYHDHGMSGHRGDKRMLEALTRTFHWHGVARDVAQYVASCPSCQRNKTSTSKPGGLLQPMPIPTRPWGSVSLDFIGPLPVTTNGHNAILVFVDRLTKMTRLCATHTTCSAPDVAELFMRHVFANGHGLPDDFVSDRDTRFTSRFWKEFVAALEIRLRMSTSFHPQTDGQTERMNRLIEETLRHYVNPTQSDWDEHLPMVEFAINDSKNASIGTTPFRLNYTWDVKLPPAPKRPRGDAKCMRAADYARAMRERLQRAKELICAAQSRQKAHADKKRVEVTYEEGDWVMLNTRNLKRKGPKDAAKKARTKLLPRFIGPYRIRALHGPVAAELELPKEFGRTHPTFHVSLLKKFVSRAGEAPKAPLPPPILLEGEVYYEVSRIVNHRIKKKGKKQIREFEVEWKGYDSSENTWEHEHELREQDLVSQEIDRYLRHNKLPIHLV